MKPLFFLIISILLLPTVFAQDFKSGDEKVDRWLVNINFVAENSENAITALAESYKVDPSDLLNYHYEMEWSVADLHAFMALKSVTNSDWETVQTAMYQHRSSGWQAVLKALGVTPDSGKFNQFKKKIQSAAPKDDLEADSKNVFKQNTEQ